MGKAHATMYTDEAKGRLKTGGAIFAETSAVIPAQAGIQRCWSDTCIRQKTFVASIVSEKNAVGKCRIRESDLLLN